MIICIHHNPQNNAVSLMFEGGPPEAVEQLMMQLAEKIRNDIAAQQQQQQSNGQPRPSGIILPPTFIPKDMKGGVNDA